MFGWFGLRESQQRLGRYEGAKVELKLTLQSRNKGSMKTLGKRKLQLLPYVMAKRQKLELSLASSRTVDYQI
jgi:hypothetical protein